MLLDDWLKHQRFLAPADDGKAGAQATAEPDDAPEGDAPDEGADDGEADEGEPEPEPEPEPESESQSLRDYLKARNVPVGDEDDDESVIERLLTTHGSLQQQNQQYAQQAAALEQQVRQYHAWQAQLAQQQQQAAQQAQQRKYAGLLAQWNQVPEYNEQWLEFVTADEKGNPILKPGADPALLQKISERSRWERQAMQTLITKPIEVVEDAVLSNPRILQTIQQQAVAAAMQIVQARAQQESEAAQVAAEFATWGFDEKRNLTAAGSLYLQAVRQLQGDPRLPDVRSQHQAAIGLIQPLLQQQQQATAAAKPGGDKKRIDVLRKAAAKNNGRGGSLPRAERRTPPQNRGLSLEERMKRAFADVEVAA